MPNIKEYDRKHFEQLIASLNSTVILNAGELNYVLTKIVHHYLNKAKKDSNYEANYQAMNDVMGALEGCKLELYRRRIAPYEDLKIEENGDV